MKPKILVYDIETTPLITYTWKTWQADAIEVIEDWQILCFAYKWLGEKKTYVVAQNDYKDYKPGVNHDKHVIEVLWDLFDKADAVVAHNGDQFDQKKSMARFIQYDLKPPTPYIQIDTKKIAKRYFGFTSNKLADLAKYLHVEDKGSPGGFETWKACVAGDKKSWDRMKKYNIQDVKTLEQIYLKLRPYDMRGLAMNVLNDNFHLCPHCGKGKMTRCKTYTSSKTGRTTEYYRCMKCGGMAHKRIPVDSFKKVDYIT